MPFLQKHISRGVEDVNIYSLCTFVGVIKQEALRRDTFALRFRLNVYCLSWGSKEDPRTGEMFLVLWVESRLGTDA